VDTIAGDYTIIRMVSVLITVAAFTPLAPFVMVSFIAPESIGSPFLKSTSSICPAVTSASKLTSIAPYPTRGRHGLGH